MSRTYPKGFERFTVAARSNLIHSVQHEPEGDSSVSHHSVKDTSEQGEMFLKAMECAKVAFSPTAGRDSVAAHGLLVTSDTLFNSESRGTDSPLSSPLKSSFSAEEHSSGPTCQVNVVTRSGKVTDPLSPLDIH